MSVEGGHDRTLRGFGVVAFLALQQYFIQLLVIKRYLFLK